MTIPDPISFLLALLAAFVGLGAGWLHFSSLARIADMLAEGKVAAVGLQLVRLGLLAVLLWLFAQGGVWVLIAGTAGVLAGRSVALRRAR